MSVFEDILIDLRDCIQNSDEFKDIDVYLDESLKEYKIVYPACGSSNSAVKLTIKELEESSNYKKWINVTK